MAESQNYDGFIFTHIPKCGGSSLRRLVYQSALASEISPEQIHIPGEGGLSHDKNIRQLSQKEFNLLKSKEIKVLADHSKLDFELYAELGMQNPFIITVLRAPFERFLSHYNFFYKKVGHGKLKGKSIQSLPIKQVETIIKRQANVMTAYLLNEEPGVENTKMITTQIEKLESTLRTKINVFGTLDDVADCINAISLTKPNWLNWNTELAQINTNKYQPDFQGIKKLRQMFNKHNLLDLRLYQYAKALKNLRKVSK